MKIFVTVALFATIGLSFAADEHSTHPDNQVDFVRDLIKRGETILSHNRDILTALQKQNVGHLTEAMEHQLTLLEALVVDLREQEKLDRHNIHHLHVLEEELLKSENRIAEELAVIFAHNGEHKNQGSTAVELVKKGETLVKDAEAELKKVENSREANDIRHEIHRVEALIKELREHPEGRELEKDESELARHERSLKQLLERAKESERHRHHGDNN